MMHLIRHRHVFTIFRVLTMVVDGYILPQSNDIRLCWTYRKQYIELCGEGIASITFLVCDSALTDHAGKGGGV